MEKRITLILFLFFLSACSSQTSGWMIYYGKNLNASSLSKLNFIITDPDNITPASYPKTTKFIAYLSVGEIHDTRPYFVLFNNSKTILEKNPDWDGAYRVDIRNAKWQTYLINTLIPRFMADGYSGLFLDTLDTALYAENVLNQQGSQEALLGFIAKLHNQYPDLEIYTNNALALLDKMGNIITGAVAEDVMTGYDFKNKTYTDVARDEREVKIRYLQSFKERFNKPVYVVLYGTNIHSYRIQNGIRDLKKMGFHYLVSDILFEKNVLIEDE
ncbi:endo alpha-1,4 polygalactosaminidase [bacterium]|nr:endo alpha-1,4 polygalactosaminidase [bacterium]